MCYSVLLFFILPIVHYFGSKGRYSDGFNIFVVDNEVNNLGTIGP